MDHRSVINSAEKLQLASITVRNIDEQTERKLRLRAAAHLLSIEEEARNILLNALADQPQDENWAWQVRELFQPFGGVELEFPERTMRGG